MNLKTLTQKLVVFVTICRVEMLTNLHTNVILMKWFYAKIIE